MAYDTFAAFVPEGATHMYVPFEGKGFPDLSKHVVNSNCV